MNHHNSSEFIPVEEAMGPRGKATPRFDRSNTNDLMTTVFPPIQWVIPGYLPEGFSVLAGARNSGKHGWLSISHWQSPQVAVLSVPSRAG